MFLCVLCYNLKHFMQFYSKKQMMHMEPALHTSTLNIAAVSNSCIFLQAFHFPNTVP